MLNTIVNGNTWSQADPRLSDIKAVQRNPAHKCMFVFQESTGMDRSTKMTRNGRIPMRKFFTEPDFPFLFLKQNLTINMLPLASRGGQYSVGRQLNIVDGVQLSDLDEFDAVVRRKLEHSAASPIMRRLFSTLTFNPKLLKQNAFIGVVSEYIKTLASSFCRSK